MAKKRILVPILALILVLIMSVGLFVACDDDPQPVEYTVTFTQGDGTSSSVTVVEGTALTAEQIPQYVAAPGSNVAFDGWFVDATKIEAGFIPTANVTASAHTTNLYTITFKNGDEVVEEVAVRADSTIAEDDIPEALQAAVGFRFDGWFIDETKVEAGSAIGANVVAQAKFVDAMAGSYTDGMYTIVLDGAGAIEIVDYRENRFAGTYTIVDGAIVADFEDDDLDTSYAIIEDGKVITEEYYGDVVEYVKEGATFDSHVQDFVGVWKYMDTTYGEPVETFIDVSLDGESIVILVNGEDMPYTAQNYNGTKVSWYYGSNVLAFDGDVLKLNGEFVCTKVDTAETKFTVSFELEDGTVVASQQVAYGQALNADELPSDADVTAPFGFAFDGWFNENDDALDEEAKVYANATYVAVFSQESIIVKFMNGDQEVSKVAVAFDGGKLQASDIPAAVSGEGVFVGFYDEDGVKAAADVTPSIEYVDEVAVAIYNATFVSEASYTGRFVDGANGISITFGEDGAVVGMGLDETFEYNAETGAMTFTDGFGYSQEMWTLLVVGDQLLVDHAHYDEYEELVTDKYTLVRGEAGQYFGVYKKDDSYVFEFANEDVVTVVNGSEVAVGKIVADGDNFKIVYKYSLDGSESERKIAFDEKGNIVRLDDNTIYVKGVESYNRFYNREFGYIYEYTVGGEKVYVIEADDASYYCTVSGALSADTGEITVSYTDSEDKAQQMVIKISGTNYVAASAERGTYTGAEGALYLDGFGAGKLGEGAIEYTLSGKGYALIGEKAYVLAEDKTYTVIAQKDGYQGAFNRSDNTSYVYTFDGFGGVVLNVYSSEYPGSYTVNDEGTEMTIVITGSYSSYGGKFAILEEGGVLDRTESSALTLIKQGYTPVDYLNDMVGYYKDAQNPTQLEIIGGGTKIYVKIEDKVFVATSNYNHSVMNFEIESVPYTIEKTAAGIKVTATVGGTPQEINLAKADKGITVDTTQLLGKWELATSSNYRTFEFLESGKVSVYTVSSYSGSESTKEVDYKVEGNVVTFALGSYDKYSATFADGVLALSTVSYNGGLSPEGNAKKIADPVVQGGGEEQPADAFAGTYTKDSYILVFNGNGTGTWNDGTSTYNFTYTVNGNEATMSTFAAFDGSGNKATLTATGVSIHFEDSYKENVYNAELTKQAAAEEKLDAFAGTWSNGRATVTFDGKGKGTWGGTAFDYTVTNGTATFTVAGYVITAKATSATVLEMEDDCYGEFVTTKTFNKQ